MINVWDYYILLSTWRQFIRRTTKQSLSEINKIKTQFLQEEFLAHMLLFYIEYVLILQMQNELSPFTHATFMYRCAEICFRSSKWFEWGPGCPLRAPSPELIHDRMPGPIRHAGNCVHKSRLSRDYSTCVKADLERNGWDNEAFLVHGNGGS